MATPVHYQTTTGIGVDPTQYYVATFSAGASITPEYPAAPYLPGTRAFGSDGSEFIFVQASTAVNLTDFVILNSGSQGGGTYQANPVSNTTVTSSLAVGLASTGLVLRQSVTTIPAGAFFWALTKGQFVPATTSGGTSGLATNTSGVPLFTSATTGILTSVTTSQSLAGAFAGIICVNSLTVSIPSSVVPPVGDTKSNGFTVGPVVNLNNPRPVVILESTANAVLPLDSLSIWSF